MKPFSIISILIIAACIQGCSEENAIPETDQLQFTFSLIPSENANGRTESTLPEGSTLLLSLTDRTGNPVLSHHRIDILQMGESYITEPLALKRGNYKITDFMLVNESSEVLYATPQRGSPLAGAVKHPLPYGLGVGANAVRNVVMEVIGVGKTAPENFGYLSFNVDIIHPWSISVFIIEDSKAALTEATAILVKDGVEKFNYALHPRANILPFKGDTASGYTLVVRKEGYQDYAIPFHYNDLFSELKGKPLSVVLRPDTSAEERLTLVPENLEYGFFIDFTFPLSITIDWGDGQSENHAFDETNLPYPFMDFSHIYEENIRPVMVSGDLENIWHLSIDASVSSIDTKWLTALTELSIYAANMEVLDLRMNHKLAKLNFNSGIVKTLKLGDEHHINAVTIARSFEIENIDEIIRNIFTNASKNAITGGVFYLLNPSIHPSNESLKMLQDLENDYQWAINVVE